MFLGCVLKKTLTCYLCLNGGYFPLCILSFLFKSSHSSYPHVCSPALRLIACNNGPFYSMEDHSYTIGVECFGSMQGNCVPFQFLKPYLMYSATIATSTALDFSKGNVGDGVVNSLPSHSTERTLVYSPSPLHDC